MVGVRVVGVRGSVSVRGGLGVKGGWCEGWLV